MAVDTNLQLQQGETAAQYTTRVAAYQAAQSGTTQTGTTSTASTTTTSPAGDFLQQLQTKLLGQSDIISSENTQLENKINQAISGVQTSADKAGQATTIDYGLKEDQARLDGQRAYTSAEEGQRGFATNTAALQHIQDVTTKNINDLEKQKQSLLLQGQAAAASTISGLQMDAIRTQQQAQQQVFSNLLGIANFAQQNFQFQQQQAQATRAQAFQEQSAISSIALKYGLQIGPNETLSSITTKAMPFASAEEQAQLAKLRSDTTLNNAQATKALADAKGSGGGALSALQITSIAQAYRSPYGGAGVLANVKDPNQLSAIIAKAGELELGDVGVAAQNDIANGVSLSAALNEVSTNPAIRNQAAALKAVTDAYNTAGANNPPTIQAFKQFAFPGQLPPGGLGAVQPSSAPSAESVAALAKALQGTSFGTFR